MTNIPMLATDPYGEFIPAANGLPQYVCKTGGQRLWGRPAPAR